MQKNKNKIGIIGLGIVGSALQYGFQKILGHSVAGYDIKYPETSIQDVLDTEICFICVPTKTDAQERCETSVVEKTVEELANNKYKGLVVIKSTVKPGTTDELAKKYKNLRLAFCPEFLRERVAISDFVENQDVCVIGAYNDSDYKLIKEVHGKLPKKFCRLEVKEAEFVKYFSNIFNALRIIFANEFYEVCKATGTNYQNVKNCVVLRSNIVDAYLDCNENLRGFGGVCLPKDTEAFAMFVKDLNLDLKLFDIILEENKKFKTTTFEDMRKGDKYDN